MSATPILDLEQPAPAASRRRRGRWILLGIAVGLAVVAVGILQDQGILPEWQLPEDNGWLLLPLGYVAIAIHELGHAAAARLAGLDMGAFSVGPLFWHKSGERWVFRWMWRLWGGGFFKPLTGTTGLDPAPFVWSVAGGPIASAGLTALALVLWVRSGDGGLSWIGTLIWASLLVLALSLVPFTSGMQKTDGARLWQFLRHPEEARQVMGILGVQSEEANGVRPRDWRPHLFEAMMTGADQSNGSDAWRHLLAYYRVFDAAGGEEALPHLERAIAHCARAGKALRHALFQQAAFASADALRNAESAREWLRRACKEQKPHSTEATEGAIAMCEGRYEDAIRHWGAARAFADRLKLDSGLIRFAKDKWAEREAECRTAENRRDENTAKVRGLSA